MANPVGDDISVDLRNLDGIDLEGESVKEDGGTKGPASEKILKTQISKKRMSWNAFFLLSCVFAAFNDPLPWYLLSIDITHMCVAYSLTALVVYGLLRICLDILYIIDLLISCCGIRNKRKNIAKRFRACCTTSDVNTALSKKRKPFNERIQQLLPVISRILVALPVVEMYGVAVAIVPRALSDNGLTNAFIICGSIQYILRILLLRRLPIIGTGIRRWLKPILDFVPFLLVSHLVGAIWYLLALHRYIDCLSSYCKTNFTGVDDCNGLIPSFCDLSSNIIGWNINGSLVEEACPTKKEDKNVFDFGIYLFAFQSNVVSSTNKCPKRILQSFWWALRNLSSFGSNLQTSTHATEVIFSILISIAGMALFLVYLNARVKGSQERSNRHNLEEKKQLTQERLEEKNQLTKLDIDLWLSKNNFPKGLKTMTKSKKDIREVIVENIHKLGGNKEFNMQNILSILPIRDRRCVMFRLRLASLKKVPVLVNMEEKVLREISEHLKTVIYGEDHCIVQEGKPLGKMLFITHGIALTYTTGKNSDGISCVSSSTRCLQKGDFYGGGLLDWAFKFASFADLPISTGTVMSQEKVEAFVIRASDLKSVVSKYWWYFSREFCQVEDSLMGQRDHLAASSIQATWRRRRHARVEGPTGWGRFTVN